VGFVVDKAALGQVFSEYFGFPCQSFHQFLHHHNHPALALLVAAVPSGPNWTPTPHDNNKKIKIISLGILEQLRRITRM
jgi:hypothetical protein